MMNYVHPHSLQECTILDEFAALAMYQINVFAFPMIMLARHQFQNQFYIYHSSQRK